MQQQNLYLGIDVGTSGVRTAVIDDSGTVISSASTAMEAPIQIDHRPCQDANIWWQATGLFAEAESAAPDDRLAHV